MNWAVWLFDGMEWFTQPEEEKKEQHKKWNTYYKIGYWKDTGYDQRGVLSSLIKEIRIWNCLQALYRTQVMLEAWWNVGRDYIMKRLTIEASETFWWKDVVDYTASVMQFFKEYSYSETDNLYHLICYMCFRWKHCKECEYRWENRLWILLEPYYTWLIWYFVPWVFEWKIKKIEYPSYAMDRHTRLWKSIVNKWWVVDNRWSWTDSWRRKSIEIALSYDLDAINPDTDYPITHHNEGEYVFKPYDRVPYKYFPKNVKELEEYYTLGKEDFKKFVFEVFAELEKEWIYNPKNF